MKSIINLSRERSLMLFRRAPTYRCNSFSIASKNANWRWGSSLQQHHNTNISSRRISFLLISTLLLSRIYFCFIFDYGKIDSSIGYLMLSKYQKSTSHLRFLVVCFWDLALETGRDTFLCTYCRSMKLKFLNLSLLRIF